MGRNRELRFWAVKMQRRLKQEATGQAFTLADCFWAPELSNITFASDIPRMIAFIVYSPCRNTHRVLALRPSPPLIPNTYITRRLFLLASRAAPAAGSGRGGKARSGSVGGYPATVDSASDVGERCWCSGRRKGNEKPWRLES